MVPSKNFQDLIQLCPLIVLSNDTTGVVAMEGLQYLKRFLIFFLKMTWIYVYCLDKQGYIKKMKYLSWRKSYFPIKNKVCILFYFLVFTLCG